MLNLNTWAITDIENAASKSLKVFASNLDSDFPSEVVQFAFHLRSSPDLGSKKNTAQAQLSYLKKNCLIETFPNVAIILRVYLTLPVGPPKLAWAPPNWGVQIRKVNVLFRH